MKWLRRGWWAITHPIDAFCVLLLALLLIAAPELALMVLFIIWLEGETTTKTMRGPGWVARTVR